MNHSSVESPHLPDIYVVNKHATNGNGFRPPEGAEVLYTEADREENIKNLGELLAQGPRKVKVKAGDGTVAWTIEAAVLSGQAVDIGIEEGGYKNDLATMVKKAGGQLTIQPLVLEKQCVQQDDDNKKWKRERMVAYSFGLGAIAVGAKIANSREFRDKKDEWIEGVANLGLPRWLVNPGYWGSKIADVGLVRRILAPEVEIDGQKIPTHAIVNGRRIGAMIVSNGEIMSGGGMRFRLQRLNKPRFVTTWVGEGGASKLSSMAARVSGIHLINDRWTMGSGDPFELNERTLAQADGEDFELESGVYRIRELGKTAVTLSVSNDKKK